MKVDEHFVTPNNFLFIFIHQDFIFQGFHLISFLLFNFKSLLRNKIHKKAEVRFPYLCENISQQKYFDWIKPVWAKPFKNICAANTDQLQSKSWGFSIHNIKVVHEHKSLFFHREVCNTDSYSNAFPFCVSQYDRTLWSVVSTQSDLLWYKFWLTLITYCWRM